MTITMRSSLYQMMLAYAMAGMMTNLDQSHNTLPRMTEEEADELRRIREAKIAELKRKGQKPFEFDGVTIYALNRKNAERKHKSFLKNN